MYCALCTLHGACYLRALLGTKRRKNTAIFFFFSCCSVRAGCPRERGNGDELDLASREPLTALLLLVPSPRLWGCCSAGYKIGFAHDSNVLYSNVVPHNSIVPQQQRENQITNYE